MLLEKYQTLQDWLGLLFLIKNKFRNKIPVASDFVKKTDYGAKRSEVEVKYVAYSNCN